MYPEKRLSNYLIFAIAVLLLLLSLLAKAQAPQQFSFQGVARDATGKVLANRTVKLQLTIHKTTPSGQTTFQEQHDALTNAAGIFNVSVGGVGGNLSTVDWKSDIYFLQVELDPDGGSDFTDLGATQLFSVPYALHAEEASRLKNDDPIILKGINGNGAVLAPVGTGARLIWYPRKSAFRAGNHSNGLWDDVNIGQSSIGFGNNPLASGEYSIALGASTSTAANTIAIGNDSKATGSGAIAIGGDNIATRDGSIAIGNRAESTGDYGMALGYFNEVSGFTSASVGSFNEVHSDGSGAFGSSNTAIGKNSFLFGSDLVAKAFQGVAIGTYNSNNDNPNPLVGNAADRIFQIGKGSSENARSNAMTILRNGHIGLGGNVLNPQFLLDLGGRARIRYNNETAGIYFDGSVSANEGFVGMKTNTEIGLYINTAWRFWVTAQGNGYLNGSLIQVSDRRLKTNIQPFKNSLEKVSDLQGYHYNWKDKTKDQVLQTGLIAQEIEGIFPELVSTNKEGFKSVNYIGLVPHLIESVKELKSKTDEIAVLQKELEGMRELGRRLELLEASMNTEMNVGSKTDAK